MTRIIRDTLDPSEQHRYYSVTNKEPSSSSKVRRMFEEDMKQVADWLETQFGRGAFTIKDAFRDVFGPMGYSYYKASDLIKECKDCGFLESTNIS